MMQQFIEYQKDCMNLKTSFPEENFMINFCDYCLPNNEANIDVTRFINQNTHQI